MTESVDLKVVLLGSVGVGKTCLSVRYIFGTFGAVNSTVGASFQQRKVERADGSSTIVGIWDTAGAERFDSLSSFYCRGAQAAICCYDMSDKESFSDLSTRWIKKVIEGGDESCHLILCGTKADLIAKQPGQRGVPAERVAALAARHGADVFETSSQTGDGIRELFDCILQKHAELSELRAVEASPVRDTIKLTSSPSEAAGADSYCGGCGG